MVSAQDRTQLKPRRGARDLGGPVSLDYYDRAPFRSFGPIELESR
jgi:hypothetical protein